MVVSGGRDGGEVGGRDKRNGAQSSTKAMIGKHVVVAICMELSMLFPICREIFSTQSSKWIAVATGNNPRLWWSKNLVEWLIPPYTAHFILLVPVSNVKLAVGMLYKRERTAIRRVRSLFGTISMI